MRFKENSHENVVYNSCSYQPDVKEKESNTEKIDSNHLHKHDATLSIAFNLPDDNDLIEFDHINSLNAKVAII